MSLGTAAGAPRAAGLLSILTLIAGLAAPSPASAQSRIPATYAGTAGGSVHRVDVCSGTIDWTASVSGAVQCVAASRLGEFVVVGSTNELALFREDSSLVWSVPNGVNARNLVELSQVAIDERGQYLVAAHSNGNVSLYHRSSATPVWSNLSGAVSVAISWNGDHVFAGGSNGVAYYTKSGPMWTMSDGLPQWTDSCGFSTMTVDIKKFDTGTMYMVAGSTNSTVCLWDESGSLIWSWTSPKGDLMSVSMNPMGDRVAAGNDDSSDSAGAQLSLFSSLKNSVPLWQAADGTPLWTDSGLGSPGDDVRAIEFESTAPFHRSGEGDDFVAGGSGFPLQEYGEGSSSAVWTGRADREVEDIAFMELDPYDSYVVVADIATSSLAIHRTDELLPLYSVATTGNCRSVSMPTGPIAGNIGANYCIGAPNSVEAEGATISAWGSDVVSDNDVTLAVIGGVPNQNGLFFYGPLQGQIPFGNGFLCVVGGLVRINPPVQMNSCGVVQRVLDLTLAPHSVLIVPNSVWHFQYWYRDPGAGVSGFNLSDAVEIPFQ